MQLLISALQLPAGAISHPHTHLPAGHDCALQLSHADTHADAYKHTGALHLPVGLQLSDARAGKLQLPRHCRSSLQLRPETNAGAVYLGLQLYRAPGRHPVFDRPPLRDHRQRDHGGQRADQPRPHP